MNERVKRGAIAVLKYLVNTTPVDTSQALSNWEVSTAGPVYHVNSLPPYVPGSGGSTKTASAQEALRVGMAIIATKKPGQKLYISNSVPYIEKLNTGHSKQVPVYWTRGVHMIFRNSLKIGTGNVRRTN